MDKLKLLHKTLSEKGLYTKGLEDFRLQFSTPDKQKALYGKLSEKKLYTKSFEDFQGQFFAAGSKKKVGVEPSPSGDTESPSTESSEGRPIVITDYPDQEFDSEIAEVYDQYEKAGQVSQAQEAAINQKLQDQKEGKRGFWETSRAMVDGYIKTGTTVPLFKFDDKETLMLAREEKNKVDFLSSLTEEKVQELNTYANNKITELDSSNKNILAENSMLNEKAKKLTNDFKYHTRAIQQLQEEGKPIPKEGLDRYKSLREELEKMASRYNQNIDLIESNNEDMGNFMEELYLLKKNFGGLDYYVNLARLTTADMMGGFLEASQSMGEWLEENTFIPETKSSREARKDINAFKEEVAKQKETLRPAISVANIENAEDFGSWLGDTTAQQLPVIVTLAATGGTAGLAILGTSSMGQKITEVEEERSQAQEQIGQLQEMLDSGTLSQEEADNVEGQIKQLGKSANISDDEMLLAGFGAGAFEMLTERVSLGILSKGKRSYQAAIKAGKRKDVIKGMLKGTEQVGLSGLEEGGAEFLNQFAGNVMDISLLGKTDVHVFDGTTDALASGMGMGVMMRVSPSAVGYGVKAFMPKESSAKVKEKTQKIGDLLNEIEVNAETIDDGTRAYLERKVKRMKKELANEMTSAFDRLGGMSRDNIDELIKIDKKSNKIISQVADIKKSNINKEMKTEILNDLKKEADKLTERKNAILKPEINGPDSKGRTKKQESERSGETQEGDAGATQDGTQAASAEGQSQGGEGATSQSEGDVADVQRLGKSGTVTPGNRKIRVINPFTTSKPVAEIEIPTKVDNAIDFFNQKIVNRYARIFRQQAAIEKQIGKTLPKDQNFRQAEIAMHGKAAAKLQNYHKDAEGFAKQINDSAVDFNGLADYLYAKHAKERNAHIRNLPLKNEGDVVNEAGSGMTDAEADKIIASFTGKKLADAQRLSDKVYEIVEDTRQILLESGLISKEDYNTLSTYYENYVPLRGHATEDVDTDIKTAFGLGLSVKGKEIKRAAGRSSMAENVIANAIAMRNNATIRAEKNKVMQTLKSMVEQNNGLGQVYSKYRPDVSRGLTQGGKVGDVVQNMQNLNKYVGVKVDGMQYYIKFENEHFANIINAASVEKTDLVTRTLGKFNKYMSTVLTTYNPEFVISNFERDIQAAVLNAISEKEIDPNNTINGKSFVRNTIKDTIPSIRAIYSTERGLKGTKDTEIKKFYKEFKDDGAKTDWFYAKSVADIKKDIDKIASGNKDNVAKASVKAIGKVFDDANTAVENGVRLSAYMNARKAGVSRADAAEMAKELTINFNQKGELGTLMNTIFLFFNASVQGTVRFGRAMTTLKKVVDDDGNTKYGLNTAQKIAAGMAAGSAVSTYLNYFLSGEDEDGVLFYDKIPDYEKERNFIVMDPTDEEGKRYFKIPLPYGYNIFHNMGTIATEMSMGSRSVGNGAEFMMASLLGAFSPLNIPGGEDTATRAVKVVSPTVLRPFLELAVNESHFGSAIYSEQFPGQETPDSQMGRPSTGEVFVEISKFLNEATGGTENIAGSVDINPDKIEHLFEFMTGGTGKFVNNAQKSIKFLVDKGQGKDVEIQPREIPFYRKVIGEPSEYVNVELYYDRKSELTQLVKEYESNRKEYRDDEKMKAARRLKIRMKVLDKRLKREREKVKKADKIKGPILRQKKIKKAQDKQQELILGFHKLYNELMPED